MALISTEEPEQIPEAAAPVRLAAPSLKGVVRIVAIVVACAAALYLTWQVRGVVRLVVIALFVALALNPLVDAIHGRTRAPRAAVILSLYLALAGGVVVVGVVVVPSLVKQVAQLSHDAPRYAEDLRHNATFRTYDDRYHLTPRSSPTRASCPAGSRRPPGRCRR